MEMDGLIAFMAARISLDVSLEFLQMIWTRKIDGKALFSLNIMVIFGIKGTLSCNNCNEYCYVL